MSGALPDWPDAYVRRDGRGFVLENGGAGCWLVELSGTVVDCPEHAADKKVIYYLPLSERLVLLRPTGRMLTGVSNLFAVALDNDSLQPLDDEFYALPHKAPAGLGCADTGRRALAADESAWVVACPREGLWLVTRDANPVPLRPYDHTLPPPEFLHREQRGKDSERTFAQEYGLAWSPDATRIYYCAGIEKTGVIVSLETRRVEPVSKCLAGAAWSPDGRQIAGTGEGMIAAQLAVE